MSVIHHCLLSRPKHARNEAVEHYEEEEEDSPLSEPSRIYLEILLGSQHDKAEILNKEYNLDKLPYVFLN